MNLSEKETSQRPSSSNPFKNFYRNTFFLEFKNHLYNFQLRRRAVRAQLEKIFQLGLILEIGSGVSIMTERGENVLYSDITEEAMQLLKKQQIAKKAAAMSMTDLSLRNETVGTIICSEVLEHIKEDRRAIQELFRVLKPNGTLILTVPVNPRYFAFDDRFVKHERRYEVPAFLKMLQEIGFKDLEVVKVTGVLDKLAMILMTRIYSLTSQKKESSEPKSPGILAAFFLWIYKVLNGVFSIFVSLEAKLLPVSACAVVLIRGKK